MLSEIRLAELLSSKLCHDLVGPVGAISNGMELLTDESFGMSDEAIDLTATSARRAAAILQFFRTAYGAGQGGDRDDPQFLRGLAEDYLMGSKVSLSWPPADGSPGLPAGSGKIVLSLIELAREALITGGTIEVGIAQTGTGLEIAATAVGTETVLNESTRAGLDETISIEDVTARNVHGYFTRLMCRRLGGDLAVAGPQDGRMAFSLTLPA